MELAPEDTGAEVTQDATQEGATAENQQNENNGADAADGDASNGDDSGDGNEADTGDDQPEPIAAPTSWAKDAKDVFANLPREAQEIISKREADREKFIQGKSREAAMTRQTVETEARGALQTIMRNHEQALTQFLPQLPERPNPALLGTGDPAHRDLYYQQQAQYDYAAAQHAEIVQQIQQARQHAEAISQQQYNADIAAEHQMLEDNLGTEWSDPSERAKLLETLQPIAAELGYSQEVMAQARAADILALRRIADFKAKADKYDQLMKRKMEPVRAAKHQLPPAARSSGAMGGQPASDAASLLYPEDVRR